MGVIEHGPHEKCGHVRMERGRKMPRSATLLGAGLVVLAAVGLAGADTTASIVVGQTDDFEDGTVQGWVGGTIITNVSGGPTGRYLQVQTNTGGKGHWGARNPNRWGGGISRVFENYVTNDIRGIGMDLSNFGPDPLSLRLMFVNQAEEWTSTNAYLLPANSGWQHVVFGITAADMTRVSGSGSWATNDVVRAEDAHLSRRRCP